MTWRAKSLSIDGRPAHVLLDDKFAPAPPCEQLPHLAWFGVYCIRDPGSAFWDPAEGPRLDAVEDDLIRLAATHGNGQAVYVQRLDTRGLREYYVYFGDATHIDRVLLELKTMHPEYRMDYDQIDDLKWAQ